MVVPWQKSEVCSGHEIRAQIIYYVLRECLHTYETYYWAAS